MNSSQRDESFGALIKGWRKKRRLSQLSLALDAQISPKHLSFLEGGRAQPSREMVLRLCEPLKLSMRAQNALLTAAGFSAQFSQRHFDDPQLKAAVQAVQLVLRGLEPYPCIAVDKHWNIKASNDAVRHILVDLSPEVLTPPVNVLRLSLHPFGLRRRIANLEEWSSHLVHLLQEKMEMDSDPYLNDLLHELLSYNTPKRATQHEQRSAEASRANTAFIPLRLKIGDCLLTFVSTAMVFGTPTDVTMSELLIETLVPANEETAMWFEEASRVQRLIAER